MLDLRQILRGSLLDLRHPLRLGGIIITKKITDKEIIEELANDLEARGYRALARELLETWNRDGLELLEVDSHA